MVYNYKKMKGTDKGMKNPELVILAAGMGSRYGGLKQIDAVDDRGHIIIDYSIYDAIKAGFRDITFIIKKEIENRTSEKIRSAHEMVSACSSKARQKIGQKNDAKEFYDLDDLQNVLEQYVGANGEYTSVVKSLYIKMNGLLLKM